MGPAPPAPDPDPDPDPVPVRSRSRSRDARFRDARFRGARFRGARFRRRPFPAAHLPPVTHLPCRDSLLRHTHPLRHPHFGADAAFSSPRSGTRHIGQSYAIESNFREIQNKMFGPCG
ncbi:pentapeptide repeat-containing protein [uncultured Alistipes sp.]|uniref:pentapeptide repeat-containing protein n=1 Tax=uncultured Alistipes sp. TaxID=538949 RepID=UPI00349FA75E